MTTNSQRDRDIMKSSTTSPLITQPINPNEISARNTQLNNWILTENLRIINFIKKDMVCIRWEDFKLDKRCSKFNLEQKQFDLLSDAALQCKEIISEKPVHQPNLPS